MLIKMYGNHGIKGGQYIDIISSVVSILFHINQVDRLEINRETNPRVMYDGTHNPHNQYIRSFVFICSR